MSNVCSVDKFVLVQKYAFKNMYLFNSLFFFVNNLDNFETFFLENNKWSADCIYNAHFSF